MDHTAAQLDVVIAVCTFDKCVCTLESHVGEAEEFHVEFKYHAAHINGRMARLGIDSADMGHADHKVDVAHDFRIQNIRDLRDLLLLSCLPVIE